MLPEGNHAQVHFIITHHSWTRTMNGTEIVDCSWMSPLSSPSRKSVAKKKFPESSHSNNEESEDVLGSSPTSVTGSILQDGNKKLAIINGGAVASPITSDLKTKVKTLIKGYSWDLPVSTKYASDVKRILSSNSSIAAEDIMLVSKGQEVLEEMEVSSSSVMYALVRTKAASKISLKLCVNDGSGKSKMEFISSAGTKIYQLKRELKKVCKISEFGMRCILGGRVLRDENVLGDYVLSTALCSKVQNKRAKEITVYVNKTVDLKRDVDVDFHIVGGKVIKSYFDIKSPIIGLMALLKGKAHFPPCLVVNLCVEISNTLVQLDLDKCLFDYGVIGDKVGQVVNVFVVPSDVLVPTTRDLSSNFIARVNPMTLFSSIKQLDSKSSSKKTISSNERMKDVDSICERADSLARAIALKTKLHPEKNSITDAMGVKVKKAKTSGDGGLFSRMKKGFLAKSKVSNSKKESVLLAETKSETTKKTVNHDLTNPYDDPDSPLNQMD